MKKEKSLTQRAYEEERANYVFHVLTIVLSAALTFVFLYATSYVHFGPHSIEKWAVVPTGILLCILMFFSAIFCILLLTEFSNAYARYQKARRQNSTQEVIRRMKGDEE